MEPLASVDFYWRWGYACGCTDCEETWIAEEDLDFLSRKRICDLHCFLICEYYE
jgi:hypothetical protein